MKYLLIIQTQHGNKQVSMEAPQLDLGDFFRGVFIIAKKLFMY